MRSTNRKTLSLLAVLGLMVAGCGGGSSPDAGDLRDAAVEADSGPAVDAGPPPSSCTGCEIGGTCYGEGQRNPTNQCEVCSSATSATAWTPNDGQSCDDGLFCTASDVCTGTTCGGVARDCSDGIACNGTEACDEAAGQCGAGASTCDGGTICEPSSDSCVTTCSGCVIDGVCYGEGQVNPANPCAVCDAATSATAWSDNDGARCDDGLFCTDGDVCSAGACAGSARSCSDGVDCNGAETCDEDADACAAGATTCAGTEVCDAVSNMCVTTCAGCVIGGVCYADGTRNPANQCEICSADASASAWTANDGATCDDGEFCTRGDVCSGGMCAGSLTNFCDDSVGCNGTETCNDATDRCVAGASTCGAGQLCDVSADMCATACSGCVIGGVCYAPNTRNPADQCQVCDTASSATAWTTNTGASCDDGLFCTTADSCSAGGVCGGTARSCGDGVTCNGAESCNESGDRCDAGTPTCGAGELCDTVSDMCVTACTGCVIGGVCHADGSSNPMNSCLVCDIGSSTTAWTPNTGAICNDGLYCNTGERCDAAGACTGGSARTCGDGVACNGVESCNEGSDTCDPGSTTCGAGQVCDAMMDSCVASCGTGLTDCGGMCVNTTYDPLNCGGCGMPCGANQACVSGACRSFGGGPARYVYMANWAAFNTRFDVYNIGTSTWSVGATLPVTSSGQLASDGSTVWMLGTDQNVYQYDVATNVWTMRMAGPGGIGSYSFFQWLNGNFYLCQQSTSTLHIYSGGAWSSQALSSTCSIAGGTDPAANEVYIKRYGQAGFWVIDATSNTVVRTITDGTMIGENTSSGATLAGTFYTRSNSGQIFALDGTTGARTDTGHDPGGNYPGFATDPGAGVIYMLSTSGFSTYDPATGGFTPLTAGPTQSTLATLALTF